MFGLIQLRFLHTRLQSLILEATTRIMVLPKSLPITALLLGATVNAQVYETGGRSEDAFSWVQPEDTIIPDQYNSSEPVYPSRESMTSQQLAHRRY
jgi:hypothetical protein